jgi:exodeoxyribonuclease V beta subunit
VFTYARAADSVEEERKHTLIHNWRSEPGLIEAVNAIFSSVEDPFVFDWIRFDPAEPTTKTGRKTLAGLDEGPLQVWFLEAQGGAELTVERATGAVCRAVASEISRLLNLSSRGEVMLGNEGIRPSDMAVLVRTNTQARMVRDGLRAAGIATVLYSDENVFLSVEALETEMLLAALADPSREGLVRAALMTRIFALDAAAIDALSRDEAAWEVWIERFRGWNDTWARFGFTPMIRRLLDGERVRERLLAMDGGERALTNVLHIAELLGRAEASDKLGMQGLRKWLAERRAPDLPGSDEYQLRLESDDDAVRVMTVHKSKGLEFPVVFCPFAWGSAKADRREGVLFHDDSRSAVLDLGSTEQETHRTRAGQETLAENVRLLYVALTRARNRCYVAWGKVRGAEKSAMAHLMMGIGETDMRRGLEEVLVQGTGQAHVTDLPEDRPELLKGADESPAEPAARVFSRGIVRTWGIASYTAFIRGLHRGGEAADRDALWKGPGVGTEEQGEKPRDIFSFPRGARAGTLLHEVFERLDFTADDAAIRSVVEEALGSHGFDAAWAEAVTCMAVRVLHADLGGVGLAHVKNSEKLTELEFLLTLKPLTPAGLDEAFRDFMPPYSAGGMPGPTPRFNFDPVKGFLRGFMDLIFRHDGKYYLVDWKSNHLGDAVEDYGEEVLKEAMVKNHYVIQYHLYCVALDRYLRRRLEGYSYDRHFGGVFYVFLRGVGPGYGVFRARPDEASLERLAGTLMERG